MRNLVIVDGARIADRHPGLDIVRNLGLFHNGSNRLKYKKI